MGIHLTWAVSALQVLVQCSSTCQACMCGQVATACAATVRALGSKQERLGGSVGQAKQAAALADAKCAALGAELARLWRESGVKRIASDTLGRRVQRSAAKCRAGGIG